MDDFQMVRRMYEQFGFQTQDIELGFKTVINNIQYLFGIQSEFDSIGEVDRFFLYFHQGFHRDSLGENLEQSVSEDLYFYERELCRTVVQDFLSKNKDAINEKMKETIDEACEFLSQMVIDEKRKMSIKEYIGFAAFKGAEALPIISLNVPHETINDIRKSISELDGALKKKVLIGIVPTLQQIWKKANNLVFRLKRKDLAIELDAFLSEYYTEEMITVIKSKSNEKVMMKIYGLMWKEVFEQNPLYCEVEEFVLKLKNEDSYAVELTNKGEVRLIDDYYKRDFNPDFFHFGLAKGEILVDVSAVLMGYDLSKSDVNFMHTNFQIMIFDKTVIGGTNQAITDISEEKYFPTNEAVQKWMEDTKEILNWILSK